MVVFNKKKILIYTIIFILLIIIQIILLFVMSEDQKFIRNSHIINYIVQKVQDFYEKEGEFPKSLSLLGMPNEYLYTAWGDKIQFESQKNGFFLKYISNDQKIVRKYSLENLDSTGKFIVTCEIEEK